jgi:uncharacterized protein (DUF305 family)
MTIARTMFAAAIAATAFSAPVLAQEPEFNLPKQCGTTTAMGKMDHSAMGHGGMQGGQGGMMGMMGMGGVDLAAMPEHVQENMRRMMISMPAMHDGMMNENADVAFACGMIAHHQGAIDMAEVLLEHGEDPKMRALAEGIIAAQVGEIELMTKWLTENAN